MVNGALWTISYEFRCYLLVALIGMVGLFPKRMFWVFSSIVLIAAMSWPSLRQVPQPFKGFEFFFGRPYDDVRMTAAFLLGACYYFFQDHIPYRAWGATIATTALYIVSRAQPSAMELAVVLGGSYLVFYAAHILANSLKWMRRMPDISYGTYLYGWPVLGLTVWYLRPPPLAAFAIGTALCFIFGWMSWHFVERPMLKLKAQPTAPLPPA